MRSPARAETGESDGPWALTLLDRRWWPGRAAGGLVALNATVPGRLLIDAHLAEFAWLGVRWYLGNPFTADDIRLRLKTASGSASELPPAVPPRDARLALLQELAFFRSHRAEVVNHAVSVARPFFDIAARLIGVTYVELIRMLPSELLESLDGRAVDHSLLGQRREAFGSVLLEGSFSEYSGHVAVAAVERVLDVEPSETVLRRQETAGDVLLRGVIASPGRSVGTVRIVRTKDDDQKVRAGDVLVTTMTFPSLVGSMQRSAAIVTDDGGLLSHAAITARELGKPCLIDTRDATEVLVDGQLIDVDCIKGVVRAAQARKARSQMKGDHSE